MVIIMNYRYVLMIVILSLMITPFSTSVLNRASVSPSRSIHKPVPVSGHVESTSSDSDGCILRSHRDSIIDVPSWQVGDTWTYYVKTYSNTTASTDFVSLWSNITCTVSKIDNYNKNGTLYLAYNITLTGNVLGKVGVDNATYDYDGKGSGPPDPTQKGTVSGFRVIRTSDLAVLYERASYNGRIHVYTGLPPPFDWVAPETIFTFIVWDADPVENVDFPGRDNDRFWFNTTQRRIADLEIPSMTEYNTHQDYSCPYNFTVDGSSHVQNHVIAGTFDTYYLDAFSSVNDEKRERWYSPAVRNFVRENQFNIRSGPTMMRTTWELRSYNVAQNANTIELLPSTNLMAAPTLVTGSFPGNPDEDVTIILPFTGVTWQGRTDTGGNYSVQIISPSCWDATNTTTDNGSFGVCAFMDLAPHNKVMTQTLTIVKSDENGPSANAGTSVNIPEDTPYMFNASGSTDDHAIANYTWQYDSSTGSVSLYGRTPANTFELPGNYTVTLTVTDIGGNTDVDSIYVNVMDITPPVVITEHTGNVRIDVDTSLFLDGSASYDPEAGQIENYSWSVVPPHGVERILFGANVSFLFDELGLYNITLVVADENGNAGEAGYNVTVSDSELPLAKAGEDISIDQHEYAYFDGSESIDNTVLTDYNWSFTYDGAQYYLAGATAIFLFDTAGIYAVTLNVTDLGGNLGTDDLVVTVRDITAPVPEAGNNRSVNEGETVFLDGNGSSDNVGITEYNWTFEYDGAPVTLSGMNVSFTFDVPGEYTVTLNMSDGAGNWAVDSIIVTVLDITEPVADAGPDGDVGTSELFIFNGTMSADNVGIFNFSWTFVDDTGSVVLYGSSPSFRFEAPGTFNVTLRVEDISGNYDTDTVIITVRDTIPPAADAGGDFETVTGKKVAFDSSGSSDNIGIVHFMWNFSYDGELRSLEGMEVEFTFDEPGEYNVTLTVTDGEGNKASDHIIVRVRERDGDDDARTESSGSGLVIAIVLVVVIILFACAACVVILMKKRKRGEPEKVEGAAEDQTVSKGIPQSPPGQTPSPPKAPLTGSVPDDGGAGSAVASYPVEGNETSLAAGEGTETIQAPQCPKCGQTSEFYPEHDCYWCGSCQDYVFPDDPASAEEVGVAPENTAVEPEAMGEGEAPSE